MDDLSSLLNQVIWQSKIDSLLEEAKANQIKIVSVEANNSKEIVELKIELEKEDYLMWVDWLSDIAFEKLNCQTLVITDATSSQIRFEYEQTHHYNRSHTIKVKDFLVAVNKILCDRQVKDLEIPSIIVEEFLNFLFESYKQKILDFLETE